MDFYRVIKNRRSIRQFTDRPIPQPVLARILDAETPRQVSATVENRVHWNRW